MPLNLSPCSTFLSLCGPCVSDQVAESLVKLKQDGCCHSGPCVNCQTTKNCASSTHLSSLIASLLLLFIGFLWIASERGDGGGKKTWVREVSRFTYPTDVAIEGKVWRKAVVIGILAFFSGVGTAAPKLFKAFPSLPFVYETRLRVRDLLMHHATITVFLKDMDTW